MLFVLDQPTQSFCHFTEPPPHIPLPHASTQPLRPQTHTQTHTHRIRGGLQRRRECERREAVEQEAPAGGSVLPCRMHGCRGAARSRGRTPVVPFMAFSCTLQTRVENNSEAVPAQVLCKPSPVVAKAISCGSRCTHTHNRTCAQQPSS